jgi:hypothetical protein
MYIQFLWDLHDPITTATASPKLVTSISIFLCLSRSSSLIYPAHMSFSLSPSLTRENQSFLPSIIPFLCSNNAKERAAQVHTEPIPCNYLAFNGTIELSQRGANFTIRMWNVTNRNRTSRRCAPLIRVANGPSGSTSVPDAGENCTGALASQQELSGWTLNSYLMNLFQKITPARD